MPDAAQSELERAVHDGTDPARSAPVAAEIQLRLGQPAELVKLIDDGKLSLVEPARSTFRGHALSGLGKPAEAADAFEHALQADPGNAAAQIGLAETLVVRARSDEALKLLGGIADADPQATEARILQSRILLSRGQYSEAETILLRARDQLAPDTAVPHRAMLWTLSGGSAARPGQGRFRR